MVFIVIMVKKQKTTQLTSILHNQHTMVLRRVQNLNDFLRALWSRKQSIDMQDNREIRLFTCLRFSFAIKMIQGYASKAQPDLPEQTNDLFLKLTQNFIRLLARRICLHVGFSTVDHCYSNVSYFITEPLQKL